MNKNDISIVDTENGGDITLLNSDIELSNGLENNIYLSLFGGNVEQTSDREFRTGERRFDWWGNSVFFENDTKKQFNSRTEKAIINNIASSAGRDIIKQAILTDINHLAELGSINVNVTLTSINRISIYISVEQDETTSPEYKWLWDSLPKGTLPLDGFIPLKSSFDLSFDLSFDI